MARDRDYEWLCEREIRKEILIAIFASKDGLLSVEEIWYRKAQYSLPEIAEIVLNLLERVFIKTVEKTAEERDEDHIFYEGTEKGRVALIKDGSYNNLKEYKKKYKKMLRTERIIELESMHP